MIKDKWLWNSTQESLLIWHFRHWTIVVLQQELMVKSDYLIMVTKDNFIQENSLPMVNQLAFNGYLFLKRMQAEWLLPGFQMVL